MSDIKYPSHHGKDPRKRSGKWLCRQRSLYKQGKLLQSRIRKLERLAGWAWEVNNVDPERKKTQLLEMARQGKPKPNHASRLAQALGSYTAKKGGAYDIEFDRKIRRLVPHWWIDTVSESKKQLLEMARKGESRPTQRSGVLGKALSSYTSKNHNCYDPEFNKEIRAIGEHWFIDNKKQLLEIARQGEFRPNHRTSLAQALSKYTNKNNRYYDPKFNKEIRAEAPHWWIDTVSESKKQLLEMARKGEARPSPRTPLGGYLVRNTCPSGKGDTKFDRKIRELAPHWFINTANENKAQLLEMARKGEARPSSWTSLTNNASLGRALIAYTTYKNRDHRFDRKIRQLAPHWFKKTGMLSHRL